MIIKKNCLSSTHDDETFLLLNNEIDIFTRDVFWARTAVGKRIYSRFSWELEKS